ncbi:MAG: hypothetical protein WKG07_31960 [Hymenobacter sp.]
MTTPASMQVHGLTLAYLHEHGQARCPVMQRLHDDLRRRQRQCGTPSWSWIISMGEGQLSSAGLDNACWTYPPSCSAPQRALLAAAANASSTCA